MTQFPISSSNLLKELLVKFFADDVIENDDLSRFIFSKNHFSKKFNAVKFGAFMPPPNCQTSIFRLKITKLFGLSLKKYSRILDEKEIWDIGINHVAKMRGANLKARGDFVAGLVFDKTSLDIEVETSSHYLHANLINWPEEKHKQMEIAVTLADSSSLKIVS